MSRVHAKKSSSICQKRHLSLTPDIDSLYSTKSLHILYICL